MILGSPQFREWKTKVFDPARGQELEQRRRLEAAMPPHERQRRHELLTRKEQGGGWLRAQLTGEWTPEAQAAKERHDQAVQTVEGIERRATRRVTQRLAHEAVRPRSMPRPRGAGRPRVRRTSSSSRTSSSDPGESGSDPEDATADLIGRAA